MWKLAETYIWGTAVLHLVLEGLVVLSKFLYALFQLIQYKPEKVMACSLSC